MPLYLNALEPKISLRLRRLAKMEEAEASRLTEEEQVFRRLMLNLPLTRKDLQSLSPAGREIASLMVWGPEQRRPDPSPVPPARRKGDSTPATSQEVAPAHQPSQKKTITTVDESVDEDHVSAPSSVAAPRRAPSGPESPQEQTDPALQRVMTAERRVEPRVPYKNRALVRFLVPASAGAPSPQGCWICNFSARGMKIMIPDVPAETFRRWERTYFAPGHSTRLQVESMALPENVGPLEGLVLWVTFDGLSDAPRGNMRAGVLLQHETEEKERAFDAFFAAFVLSHGMRTPSP